MNNWLSLRFRDATVGTTTLATIVLATLVLFAASLGEKGPSIWKAFYILLFFFPPAILGALYSLFFEKSKVFGCATVLLAGIVLLFQPLVWRLLRLYLPIGCAFAAFCALIWILKSRWDT